MSAKVNEAIEWYTEKRLLYKSLAIKVESLLREILDSKSINYYSVTSRAKEIDSYKRKALQESYKEPRSEIMDMAGIRVITYTQSDAVKVSNLVKELFDVIPAHSTDKSLELGTDRVGYRSIHFIATLGKSRERLPENQIFSGMWFEIQVRTILQHAWAEFEHDRNYKFAGVLPSDIKRRVSVLAGSLELIDTEFDRISKEIDGYAASVDSKTQSGDLNVLLDSTSLVTYLNRRFSSLVGKGVEPSLRGGDNLIMAELHAMGIKTLQDLDKIIPGSYVEIKSRFLDKNASDTYVGILRDFMIIYDAEGYFAEAWNHHWDRMTRKDADALRSFGVDVDKCANVYEFDVD